MTSAVDMNRRCTTRWLTVIPLLAGAMLAARVSLRSVTANRPVDVPVAQVHRGDLNLNAYATGEMRARRSVMLIAPPIGGGSLQILHLLPSGTHVNAGAAVMEFDPSEQEYNLAQARSDLAQAGQEITKAKADADVLAAQDQVALLKARFDLRQAELDVRRNELVSAIDAKKNLLKLEEAKRVLAQLEQDAQSHAASSQASLAVTEEKRHKAELAIAEAQRNIDSMKVRSPLAGFVRVRGNMRASGGFFFTGMTIPDYRDGDQVSPGNVVAEVLDSSQMELSAKISESDRANVKPGQPVQVQVDALPGVAFHATVQGVAATASSDDFFSNDSAQTFNATFQLDHADPRLRPGFTARLTILSGQIRNALLVPRQAVFRKAGKAVVYVKSGGSFVPRDVHVRAVNESQAAVEGLGDGDQVALVNPEEKGSTAKPASSLLSLPGGAP
jgi:HlyD family secretion protein